ncbi:MAG: energy-coupled thiamine transporter ThiT [Clostridia bacterium]|nr:energy-coupled thiamine transporter ThiT [Clostridia bacterium]
MRNSKITVLTECSIMVALAFTLSCAKLYEMPLGGSVTVASMLPIMLISVKYGPVIGLGTGFVYSLTQLAQALVEGNVFPYCETGATLALCIIFDYVVPFTVIGLSGALLKTKLIKSREISFYVGMGACVLFRFLCHFVTGVAIWGQWAPEGMGKYLYSFAYNGSFLGVDLAICFAVAVIMMRKAEIRKLVGIN